MVIYNLYLPVHRKIENFRCLGNQEFQRQQCTALCAAQIIKNCDPDIFG